MQADFTTDESLAFLLPLKEANVVPEWMQNVCEVDDVKNLPDSAFADSSNRKFPIHTKEAAWLSAVSSYVYGSEVSNFSERLKAACSAYNITTEVKAAIDVLRPSVAVGIQLKEASADTIKHALELDSPDGRRRFYPINNAWSIEESSNKMASDLREKRFPVAWIRMAAQKLCKEAKSIDRDCRINSDIAILGEPRLADPETIKQALAERSRAGVVDGALEIYEKLAADYLNGEISQDEVELAWEVADVQLNVQDKVAAVHTIFNTGIPLAHVEKAASQVFSLLGTWIPYAALESLPKTLIAGCLNKEAAAVVLQAAADGDGRKATKKIASLGESDQHLLSQLILTQENVAN